MQDSKGNILNIGDRVKVSYKDDDDSIEFIGTVVDLSRFVAVRNNIGKVLDFNSEHVTFLVK